MKKKIIFITTFLVIVATAVAVVSCKKERHDQNANGCERTAQTADNMDEYLMAFKKKLLSAEKGGETISLEQAERDLGNLLNFDFGDANYATDVFQHDTIHAELTLTADGQVDISQLAVLYNEVFYQIIDTYRLVNLPEKSVFVISCNIPETKNKNVTSEELEIILVTRGYLGETATEDLENSWRPDNLGGNCAGGYVGYKGAPEVLMSRLNRNIGNYKCVNGGRVYFTEQVTSYVEANHDSLAVPTSPYHRLYVSTVPSNGICLPPARMEYYYDNATWLFIYKKHVFFPAIPNNHVPIEYYIWHHEITGSNGLPLWVWRFSIEHAKLNCTGTGNVPID